MTRRTPHLGAATAALGAALVTSLAVAPGAAVAMPAEPFPPRIELPDGFLPEGITIGEDATAWFGSRRDGDIYEVDLRTGAGETISQGPGTPSVGLKVDDLGRLFVSGGTGGDARVVDTTTGAVLATYQLSTAADRFINDSLVTDDTVWFTDSRSARLFGLPLGPDGALPAPEDVVSVPLTGEWVQPAAGSNGANGLTETPDGEALLVVNAGVLYRVDPATGDARRVDVGTADLGNGDGMLLRGRTLYVVQNFRNQVAVLRMAPDGRSGRLVDTIVEAEFDPEAEDRPADLDIPTTVAAFGRWLYVPNARFSTPPTPETDYWVSRAAIPRPGGR
jgi:sugar lactone lactonase YvrE